MSAKNLVGFLLCAVVFVATFTTTDGAGAFLNGLGLLIVVSGTAGACLLSYPWPGLVAALRVGWRSYTVEPPTPDDVVSALTRFSVHSRYDGVLALERFEGQTTTSFLKGALEMLVDGYTVEEMREILATEISHFRQRRQQHERVFRHMGRLAPAFGVAGSVIGLMGMLFGVGETAVILRTIPLALTSTLYGIVLANFFIMPVAECIHHKTLRELLAMRLVVDGVVAIAREQNPHRLERKLESFLVPATRTGSQRTIEEIRRRYEEQREAREPAGVG